VITGSSSNRTNTGHQISQTVVILNEGRNIFTDTFYAKDHPISTVNVTVSS